MKHSNSIVEQDQNGNVIKIFKPLPHMRHQQLKTFVGSDKALDKHEVDSLLLIPIFIMIFFVYIHFQ